MKMLLCLVGCLLLPSVARGEETNQRLTLDACIEIALDRSQHRRVSEYGVHIAEAQLGQANSSFWPQVEMTSALTRLDADPLYIFPEETSAYTISDFLPTPIQATVTVPEKRVKLMDQVDFRSSVDVKLPLYTGGMRRGIRQQAAAGVAAARQAVRRTDLEIVRDVTEIYYGGVLAEKLVDTAEDALARLEVTLELTENLYKNGSGRVKKTDFLKHKVVVESLRSMLADLESRRKSALMGLTNTMGLDWDAQIELTEQSIPFAHHDLDLQALVAGTYRFNPDWARLEAGISAAEGKVKEARSGRMPKLALLGNLEYIRNSYDAGIVGPDEKKTWRVGIGLKLPLFNGFRSSSQVKEASARLDRISSQKLLSEQGLALRVRHLAAKLDQAQAQEAAARAALEAATDNRELNVRAYQDELVEVEDVVESQIMEALMIAQYQKIRYDHVKARADLEFAIGTRLENVLNEI